MHSTLQHQEQESADIMNSNGISVPTFKTYKVIGPVNHNFTEGNFLKK